MDPVAKATVHAICLAHLPTGCMRFSQYSRYDAGFMVTVLREFHRYYRYETGITEADGDAVIIAHISKNYAGWLYEMR